MLVSAAGDTYCIDMYVLSCSSDLHAFATSDTPCVCKAHYCACDLSTVTQNNMDAPCICCADCAVALISL